MQRARVQTVHGPGAQAARAACALRGAGLRDPADLEHLPVRAGHVLHLLVAPQAHDVGSA